MARPHRAMHSTETLQDSPAATALPAAVPVLSRTTQGRLEEVLEPACFDYASSGVRRDNWERVAICGTFMPFVTGTATDLADFFDLRNEHRWYLEILDYVTDVSWREKGMLEDGPGAAIYWDWLGARLREKYAKTPLPDAPVSEPYRNQRDLKYVCVIVGRKLGLDVRLLADSSSPVLADIEEGIKGFLFLYLLTMTRTRSRKLYLELMSKDRTFGIMWKYLREYFAACDDDAHRHLAEWREGYDRRISSQSKKKRK